MHMKPVTIGTLDRLTTVTAPPMKMIITYQLPLLKDSFHMSQNSQQSVALMTLISKLISKKISTVAILEGQTLRQSSKFNLVSPGKIRSTKSIKQEPNKPKYPKCYNKTLSIEALSAPKPTNMILNPSKIRTLHPIKNMSNTIIKILIQPQATSSQFMEQIMLTIIFLHRLQISIVSKKTTFSTIQNHIKLTLTTFTMTTFHKEIQITLSLTNLMILLLTKHNPNKINRETTKITKIHNLTILSFETLIHSLKVKSLL